MLGNILEQQSRKLHCGGSLQYRNVSIAGLIPKGFQPQAQVKLANLDLCHKSGECAKSCARRSVCFCSQSVGGASIGLLT